VSVGLKERFLDELAPEPRALFDGRPDLDEELARCAARARETYPALVVDDALLARALGRRAESGDALATLHAADVYLAEACGKGDAAALAIFASELGPEVDRAIAKSPGLGVSAAEFRQLAFERLFVTEGGEPRIAGYRGSGSLKSWVRVMASRLVIDLSRRKDKVTHTNDELARRIGKTGDPELDYLRHAYGAALGPAFEQAVGRLSVRQRNLLRQRFLHELTADGLARMYGVHRSTIFEWLDKSRQALLHHLREALVQHIPGHELDSVVELLGSQLDVSVRRMLDSRLEDEPG
jgi:RNA polymerase sigma-70 factor (ECF subfamily)